MWKAEVNLTPLIVRGLLQVVDHIVQDCLASIMKMTTTVMMVVDRFYVSFTGADL